MATALQCPDCGFKHRLAAVGDRAVFPCSSCGRQLKVPQAYRPSAEPAKNGGAKRAGASAATGGTAAARTAARRPAPKAGGSPMRLPVRILLWVLAFVLGAVVVRALAKWTGFAGGDTFFDLLIDGSIGTYLRLFALVPVWALLATIFATLLIDGPQAWARRRAGAARVPAGAPPGKAVAGAAAAASAGASAAKRGTGRRPASAPKGAPVAAAAAGAGAARASRSIPRREPPAPKAKPRPAAPTPDPMPAPTAAVSPAAARTAAMPVARTEPADDVDPELAARVAAGQRPRRIPRRGEGS